MSRIKRTDDSFFADVDFWMIVCRDKYTGEIVGFNATLYPARKYALADRRKLVGLRESVVRVRVHEMKEGK